LAVEFGVKWKEVVKEGSFLLIVFLTKESFPFARGNQIFFFTALLLFFCSPFSSSLFVCPKSEEERARCRNCSACAAMPAHNSHSGPVPESHCVFNFALG
jgi:hypothetical protein